MANQAIDDVISDIDALISRLENPSLVAERAPSGAKQDVAEPALDFSMSSKEQQAVDSMQSEEKASEPLAAPGVEETKPPVLDIPRKSLVKTPGAAAAKPVINSATENEGNFDKAHLQVGLVQSVDNHPVSEKLYCCKVEVANGEIRKVVAGLRKFIPASDLAGKKVCVILNLKPAKLGGEVSEAMILAGDAKLDDGNESVKVLVPASGASVGDRVFLEGGSPNSTPVKQLSSKIWEKIVPLLKVQGGVAQFDSKALVTNSGVVTVPDLPDGAGIH